MAVETLVIRPGGGASVRLGVHDSTGRAVALFKEGSIDFPESVPPTSRVEGDMVLGRLRLVSPDGDTLVRLRRKRLLRRFTISAGEVQGELSTLRTREKQGALKAGTLIATRNRTAELVRDAGTALTVDLRYEVMMSDWYKEKWYYNAQQDHKAKFEGTATLIQQLPITIVAVSIMMAGGSWMHRLPRLGHWTVTKQAAGGGG